MKSIFSKILYVLVLLAVSLPAMAQRNVITGVVYDELGLPLTGASVIVEGTNRGVTTDSYGKYRIEAAPEEALIFNFLGYRSQKFKVGASTVLNAEMVPESQILDELVVVGYGVQKKVNVTGSVSTVDYEELSQSRPATTTSGLLQGVSAGLYVSQTSGKPGSEGVSMRIRGVGTLNDAAPLVIVDGFEGTINNVNPQDIASISVLKDAASCAIYGNRGANGVILITTKTAKEGRFNIEYTGMVAYQEPEHYFDVISNYADYMEIMNEFGLECRQGQCVQPDDDRPVARKGERLPTALPIRAIRTMWPIPTWTGWRRSLPLRSIRSIRSRPAARRSVSNISCRCRIWTIRA